MAALVAVVVALIAQSIGHALIKRLARGGLIIPAIGRRTRWPARIGLPLLALQVVWRAAPDELRAIDTVQHVNGVLLIAAITWLLAAAVRGVAEGVVAGHPVDGGEDNLRARRIITQARVLARTVMVMIFMAGAAMILMTFPGARQIGASLLASAGVAGLVVGIAARPLFSNLIAGLQIALAQPLRIDDVLIVKGEWGRVEEITGTYVVLRIWDQRRLIIPLQWFIENPFENWTRASAELIGAVFLRVDFHTPLEPLRAEARRLCESSKDWDGRLCVLQVTDAGEHTMELRVLVSAADSGKAFDLRCHVREGLIDLLQRDYPQHLPVWRAALSSPSPPGQ
ncbi:MAG: mechanosensitive ion channel family protein [Pseudomonadota bacterium]|nr:mechanosensitive ion channel family protein [Pseudomonadota bacterium]